MSSGGRCRRRPRRGQVAALCVCSSSGGLGTRAGYRCAEHGAGPGSGGQGLTVPVARMRQGSRPAASLPPGKSVLASLWE